MKMMRENYTDADAAGAGNPEKNASKNKSSRSSSSSSSSSICVNFILTASLKSWPAPKPPEWMDGRTGEGSLPPWTRPLIASAFGDTDGEIFDQTKFRPKSFR